MIYFLNSIIYQNSMIVINQTIFDIEFYRVGKHIGWEVFWYLLLEFYPIIG